MKQAKYIYRVIRTSGVLLLVLGSAYLGYNSVKLSNRLDKERLEKESLLSERIHLSRNLEELKKRIDSTIEKNVELTRIIESSHYQVKSKTKK